MITIFAGQEGSQVNDSQYGKPIFVSTTARILFRAANPDYKKQRNDVLNKLIADLFSKAKIEDRNFKPKGGGDAIGEFRVLGGMRFVAIIDQTSVRVISVKGSVAKLPAVAPSSILTQPKTSSLHKMAGFDSFMCSHLADFAKNRLKLSDNVFARLEAYLLPLYSQNRVKMLKSLCKKENEQDIRKFIEQQLLRDETRNYTTNDHGLHDALNIKHQW
jgi:hypothetical protein